MLELCKWTLAHVIDDEGKRASLPSELEVLYQIADGLDYIHGKNIIHRDVKPHNILISHYSKVKLADFGLCKKLDIQSASTITGIKGTLNWMAPELYEVIDEATGKYKEATKESDIFATGLVFFVFLSAGIHPFGDMNDPFQIPSNIRNKKKINGITY